MSNDKSNTPTTSSLLPHPEMISEPLHQPSTPPPAASTNSVVLLQILGKLRFVYKIQAFPLAATQKGRSLFGVYCFELPCLVGI